MTTEITNTLRYLTLCRKARAAGYPVAYATDPEWLVDMAIDRRAGWLDDPSSARGSAKPLPDGRYPPKAIGDVYQHLKAISSEVNTPRLIVRRGTLGEWHKLIMSRIPDRIRTEE